MKYTENFPLIRGVINPRSQISKSFLSRGGFIYPGVFIKRPSVLMKRGDFSVQMLTEISRPLFFADAFPA